MPDSYSAPMRSDAPSGSPKQYTDPKTIDSLLKSSDPETVAESGRSYQKFAAAYEKIAGELIAMRSDLHDAWGGQDAAAAQAQLREVWAAATTVHKTARTFGIAVERHGSESLAWYKTNKPPSKNLAEAQSWMAGANERVAQSWGSLPPDLSTTLPPGGDHAWHSGPAGTRSSSGGGGSSGTSSSSGGTAGGGGGSGSFGQFPGSHTTPPGDFLGGHTMPPGDGGTGSQLAGFAPPGDGGGAYGPGGGFGVPPGAPGGFNPGGGPLTPDGGLPGSGLIGPGGVLPGGMGSAGMNGTSPGQRTPGTPASAAAEEAQATEAGAAARAGMSGPMVSGADRKERERTRQTWLAEDEDVWTGDIQSTPQLIEAETAATTAPEPETPVEIDLSGDDDVITDLLEELGGFDDLGGDDVKDTATEIAELRAKLERLERQADADRGVAASGDDGTHDLDWITGDAG